ncbi:MAG TPA: universal stress protein [Solirubrobacterales bacterium]|jgi:nucleotide-binding universal stress UspA family protein
MEERASNGKSGPVVIGYDGSDEAAKAIAFVAGLLPGSEALVVTAWKSISEAILAVALGPAPPISDPGDADARQRRAAESLSREGAKRASQAGLRAESVAVRADGPIWAAIAKVADQRGARLVAVGAQGRAGVETVMPGSVAVGLVHHSSRPVLVVTSPQPAKEKKRAEQVVGRAQSSPRR